MISSFDRPYIGVLTLMPSAMRIVEEDVSEDYAETYKTELPWDAEGPAGGSAVAIPATTMTTASPTTTIRTTTTIRR